MQLEDNIPPVPPWFTAEVLAMLACYPSAQAGRATVAAWWRQLHSLPPEAVLYGLKRAPMAADRKDFAPSAFAVLEHAKAWRPPTPRPELGRPALPEPAPELDPSLRADFDGINAAVRAGEMDGAKAGAAYLRAIAERLR